MTPAWKRLVLSMIVLQLVIAWIVFKLANYVVWMQLYDQNHGPRATLGLLDTAPGMQTAIVFGVTVGLLLVVNVVPVFKRPPSQPVGR